MKKIVGVLLLSLSVLLFGCNNTPSSLNTDHLTKEENSGVQKGDPVIYKASSSKDALDALPFEMVLPKKLPFETKGFQSAEIRDLKNDGKKIEVRFTAIANNKRDLLMVAANNNDEPYLGNSSEKVTLKNNIKGAYSGNSLTFKNNDITYDISLAYNSKKVSPDKHKKDLIDLANQMIK